MELRKTVPSNLKYISQLNLWYDPDTDTYLNEHGSTMDITSHNKRISDRSEASAVDTTSIENLKISSSTMIQIIVLVVAAVTQYNVINNKLAEMDRKIDTVNKQDSDIINDMKELRRELTKTNAQVSIDMDTISNLQYRVAAMNVKK